MQNKDTNQLNSENLTAGQSLCFPKKHYMKCSDSVIECFTPNQWGGGILRFEPHSCHCVVVLEQDTFILD